MKNSSKTLPKILLATFFVSRRTQCKLKYIQRVKMTNILHPISDNTHYNCQSIFTSANVGTVGVQISSTHHVLNVGTGGV